MGSKIPVGATIGQTYRFALSNYFNNVGAIWMPLLVMYVAIYLLVPHYLALVLHPAVQSATIVGQNPAAARGAAMANLRALAAMAPYLAVMLAVILVCFASLAAGITREALGLRTGSAFLQFPFGKTVWRLICGYLLLVASIIGVYLAIVLVAVVVGLVAALAGVAFLGRGGAGAAGAAGIAAVTVSVITIGAAIYALVRLSFLIAPSIVAEGRVTLGWRLTRGNFWRIVALAFVVLLPLFALEIVYIVTVYGSMPPPMHPGVTPQEMAAWSRRIRLANADTIEAMRRYWFVTYPVGLFVGAFLYALMIGAAAFAYRALVPVPAPTEAQAI